MLFPDRRRVPFSSPHRADPVRAARWSGFHQSRLNSSRPVNVRNRPLQTFMDVVLIYQSPGGNLEIARVPFPGPQKFVRLQRSLITLRDDLLAADK